MESRASVDDNFCDHATHIKYEPVAAVVPRSGALFRGLRGTRRDMRQGGESAHHLAVTEHPPEIKREAPWGDEEAHVENHVGQVNGRCVTADEASATREKKKLQKYRTALVDDRGAGKVEQQTGREALMDGTGAGGFSLFEARLGEIRVKTVFEEAEGVARDSELQANGKPLAKKSAEKAR